MSKEPPSIDNLIANLCDAGCRINGDPNDGYGDYHTCEIPTVSEQLYQTILEVIGGDEEAYKMPDDPEWIDVWVNVRNKLRAEQRKKLAKLFSKAGEGNYATN